MPAPDGQFLAEPVPVNFEAGRFRLRWRLNGMATILSGNTAAPIPLGA